MRYDAKSLNINVVFSGNMVVIVLSSQDFQNILENLLCKFHQFCH